MNIKNYLLGAFEISLYMRDGVGRFNNDIKPFWQSFVILALSIPFIPLSIPYVYESDPNLQMLSVNAVVWLFIIKFIMVVATLITISYVLCGLLKKAHDFRRYIAASNWASLIALILYVPFIFLMVIDVFTYAELSGYLFVISIYIYSLGAYINKRILEIPWSLAIAISIVSLFVNDVYFNALYLFVGLYK